MYFLPGTETVRTVDEHVHAVAIDDAEKCEGHKSNLRQKVRSNTNVWRLSQ